MIHIYSKWENGNFSSYSLKDDNYVVKEGQYASPIKLIKPILVDGVLTEGITQAEIDAQNTAQTKQNNINTYLQMKNCVWVGKTPNGLEDWAVLMGNDGKLTTVKVN